MRIRTSKRIRNIHNFKVLLYHLLDIEREFKRLEQYIERFSYPLDVSNIDELTHSAGSILHDALKALIAIEIEAKGIVGCAICEKILEQFFSLPTHIECPESDLRLTSACFKAYHKAYKEKIHKICYSLFQRIQSFYSYFVDIAEFECEMQEFNIIRELVDYIDVSRLKTILERNYRYYLKEKGLLYEKGGI
mgnify:FL=1